MAVPAGIPLYFHTMEMMAARETVPTAKMTAARVPDPQVSKKATAAERVPQNSETVVALDPQN
jgi:hypothetical protein